MSTTLNGRRKKQLAFNLKTKDTNEQNTPRVRKTASHTVVKETKQEDGSISKTKHITTIQIVDNTCGRNDRRKDQIKALRAKVEAAQSKKSYSPKVTEEKPKAEKAKKGKGK